MRDGSRILVTGMAGFIGSHFCEAILRSHRETVIIGLDRLDETSTLERIGGTDAYKANRHRVKMIWHDLRAPINDGIAAAIGHVDYIIHLAASTHVDRSIQRPADFVMDNVLGTCHVLDFARAMTRRIHSQGRVRHLKAFVQFSTDEIFGVAPPGVAYREDDRYHSSNPYAATKAGAEELAMAYANTYGIPVLVVHAMNNFGERQHPEKFIPKVVRKLLTDDGEPLLIHADPSRTHAAVRSWLHARNTWSALAFLLDLVERGTIPLGVGAQKWNIGGEVELDCLLMARRIANILGKHLEYELVDHHSDRPGHDLRYALDPGKLHALGFAYPRTFDQSLEKTVLWYRSNPQWLGG